MELREIVKLTGLNEKQAEVYLACLKAGPASVTDLARLAKLKRTTLYHILEKLKADGFVFTAMRGKHTYYDAQSPATILQIQKAKQEAFASQMQALEEWRGVEKFLPQVKVYDGDVAVVELYDWVFRQFVDGHEVCFITCLSELQEQYQNVLDVYFKRLAEASGTKKIRELIFDDQEGRKYVKQIRARKFGHQLRLLPDTFPIHNDVAIVKNKVIFFYFTSRSYATVIENEEFAKTIKSLFEWVWLSARKI